MPIRPDSIVRSTRYGVLYVKAEDYLNDPAAREQIRKTARIMESLPDAPASPTAARRDPGMPTHRQREIRA